MKNNNKNILSKIPEIFLIIVLLLLITLQEEQIFGYKYFALNSNKNKTIEISIEDAKKLFPKAEKIEKAYGKIDVYDNQNFLIGILLNSTPHTNGIIGFASDVPVLIALSNDEKIKGIKLLKNYESPEYVKNIQKSNLLTVWNSMGISGAVNKKVDAITGATETSGGIIKTVNTRLSIYKNINSIENNFDILIVTKLLTSILLLGFALLSVLLPKYFRKYRLLLLIANLLIWGVWQGSFVSVFLLKSWLVLGVQISSKLIIFTITVLALFFPLITSKRFYCYYICPFGAAQELVAKSKIKKIKLSQKAIKILSGLGYTILLTLLLLLITGISFDLSLVEPFSVFNYKSASNVTIIIASIIIIFSIFVNRPWCRYLCPTGKLLNLFHAQK